MSELSAQLAIEALRSLLTKGLATSTDFMVGCSKITRNEIQQAWISLIPRDLDLDLYLFGSLSRYEFMDQSDLDLLVCGDFARLKPVHLEQFRRTCASLPGDKVDLKFVNKIGPISLIDNLIVQDCIYDARSLDDNEPLMLALDDVPTLKWKVLRFFFSYYFYRDYYYPLRTVSRYSSIKYSPGGSRDGIFFVWAHQILIGSKFPASSPFVVHAIKELNKLNVLINTETQVLEALGFLFLLKNEALHLNRNNSQKGRTEMSPLTIEQLYGHLDKHLRGMRIYSQDQFAEHLQEQIGLLALEVDNLLVYLVRTLAKDVNFVELRNWENLDRLPDKDILNLFERSEAPLRVLIIWWANRSGRRKLINACAQNVSTYDWAVISSLLCCGIPSKLIDRFIGKYLGSGDEHIARFIATNSRSSTQALLWASTHLKNSQKYQKLIDWRIMGDRTRYASEYGRILFST